MNSGGFSGWLARSASDLEWVRVLEGIFWVRVELESDAVEGEGRVCGNRPFVLAKCAVDSLCDEARSETKSNVGRALHETESDGSGGITRGPFDGISRPGGHLFVKHGCVDHIEAGCLGEDAAGSCQCQKAGLDKSVLHIYNNELQKGVKSDWYPKDTE